MVDLNKLALLLSRNPSFHALLEREVQETQYGNITFNFVVKDGFIDLKTLNIVRNKRIRYSGKVDTDD